MTGTDEHEPRLTIGEVASLLGVSREVLRLYERRGLLLVHKNRGRHRRYSETDVERLRCIRSAIKRHKISLEGMRRVQSMIPCWEIVKCPEQTRNACAAFLRAEAGCWTYRHTEDGCANADCRDCPVYRLASNCDAIKSMLHRASVIVPARPEVSTKGQLA